MQTSRRHRIAGLLAIAIAIGIGFATPRGTLALTPNQTTTQGVINSLNADLNTFWQSSVRSAGVTYTAPTRYVLFTTSANSPCGLETGIGAYCTGDHAFYLNKTTLDRLAAVGDYTVGAALAHEWAHHAQYLLGWIGYWKAHGYPLSTLELQADCYAGVYSRHLALVGKLASNDITEAQALFLAVGGGDHGTSAQRYAWFTFGYQQYSFSSCNIIYQ